MGSFADSGVVQFLNLVIVIVVPAAAVKGGIAVNVTVTAVARFVIVFLSGHRGVRAVRTADASVGGAALSLLERW